METIIIGGMAQAALVEEVHLAAASEALVEAHSAEEVQAEDGNAISKTTY